MREWEVGDDAYLKEPARGYRFVTVTGFCGNRLIVKTESGMELYIYEDELEDE